MSVAWVAVGASVVGSVMSANSAEDATEAQSAAAERSDSTQRYQYDTTRADNAPYQKTGVAANNRLSYLMGLPGSSGGIGPSMTRDQLRQQLLGRYTTTTEGVPQPFVDQQPFGPRVDPRYVNGTGVWNLNGDGVWAPGGSGERDADAGPAPYGGQTTQIDEAGLNAAIDAGMAADAKARADAEAAAQNDPAYGSMMRNFSANDLRNDPVLNAEDGYMQPMRDYNASDLENDPLLKAAPGYFQPLHKFGQPDLDGDLVYQSGLQYGLDEGRKSASRAGSAGGNALSGATLKALTRFGNDYATTKTAGAYDRFTNEQHTRQQQKQGSYDRFQTNQNYKYGLRVDSNNRFNTNRDGQYNKLAALTGRGQVATSQVGAAGQNMANNISASQMGMGNAQAASSIAQGNAWQNGMNGAVSAFGNRGSSGTNSLSNIYGGGGSNPQYPAYGQASGATGAWV